MSYHSEKLQIFLVEDTPAIERSVTAILEGLDCVVTVAVNFAGALKKFNLSFDGLLIDVGLPDGNGFDVVKHIHQRFPENNAVIFMYSAFGVNYIKEKIGDLPVHHYFGKPFDRSEIKNFVQAVLGNKKNTAKDRVCFFV